MRTTTTAALVFLLVLLLPACDAEGKKCSLCDPGDTCDGNKECLQFEDFLYRCARPGDECRDFFRSSPIDPGLRPMPVEDDRLGISEQPVEVTADSPYTNP